MTRLLGDSTASPPVSPSLSVDSDLVVILAGLLCALLCILGLAAVTRCTWLHLFGAAPPPPPANKGLKKKILRSLPKHTFTPEVSVLARLSDCAICLAEFAGGEEIRVLPGCGHGFHVACIDKWLGSHSSCPSCRQSLAVVERCHECGSLPGSGEKTKAKSTETVIT